VLWIAGALAPAQGASPQLPAGFVAQPIGSDWFKPTALCFIGDGRLLVAEKPGDLWYVEGTVKRNPVVSLSQETLGNGDRGLLGVAADPHFDENGRIYLLFVVDPDGADDTEQESFSRLVRYATEYDASGELHVVPGSRVDLLGESWSSGIPSLHFAHAGGSVKFMSDGSLVLSHGDGAHSNFIDAGGNDPLGFGPGKFGPEQDLGAFRALEVTSMAGKVLRIDPETGLGLPDNPFFTGNPADAASRVWALGLRNPFRFTLVPGTGPREALFACDVGSTEWEELDLCRGGESFGWPCYEGAPEMPDYQAADVIGYCDAVEGQTEAPWLSWNHWTPGNLGFVGNCVSGACVYTGTSYPPICRGALFFCDYGQSWMKVALLDPELNRVGLFSFGTEMGSPIEIVREPESGDLVYISLDHPRQVCRLRYTPSNQPPVAVAKASPPWGPSPLTVHLSASGSYDPENDTLDYHWDLGDGAISTSPELDHVYYDSSTYVVVLTVTDDFGLTDTETIVLNPDDTPPVIVSVATPADGDVYEEGVPIELDCAVADAEDDAEGIPLQVEWTFDMIHDHHEHSDWAVVSGTTGSWTPEPHGDGSHALQLTLTVTDSRGLEDERVFALYDADATPMPHIASVSDDELRLGIPLTMHAHVDYAVPPGTTPASLTIDWGDGTSDELGPAPHQVDFSVEHVYAQTGEFTLHLDAETAAASNEVTRTITVLRANRAIGVFLPLLAERYITGQEQQAIAGRLVTELADHEVAVFPWDQQAELASWLEAYLDDGVPDALVLMDLAPSLVFAGESEGSLAERWMEGGNEIVWTGAAPFAESIAPDGSTTSHGACALD